MSQAGLALFFALILVASAGLEAHAQLLPPWERPQARTAPPGAQPPPGVAPSTSSGKTNLSAGKSGAQLFASDCTGCHTNPQGLAKGRSAGALAGFLRAHYTNSRHTAVALADYLAGLPAAGGRGAKPAPAPRTTVKPAAPPPVPQPRTAVRPPETAKPEPAKPEIVKPETVKPETVKPVKPEPKAARAVAPQPLPPAATEPAPAAVQPTQPAPPAPEPVPAAPEPAMRETPAKPPAAAPEFNIFE